MIHSEFPGRLKVWGASTALVAYTLVTGCSPEPIVENDAISDDATAEMFSYDSYDALLNAYVDDTGMVNYRELQANRESLDEFVESLGAIAQAEYETWSAEEQLALWINAYNAITLKYVIDHYPIKRGFSVSAVIYPKNSIRQIPGVWKKLTSDVVGEAYTLNAIEHEILRARYSEPRIHVSIVCASISCPPLRNEAFRAEKLEKQLSDQSRKFFAIEGNFRYDASTNRVYLSSILNWFGEDFVAGYTPDEGFGTHGKVKRAVLNYVSQYVDVENAERLRTRDYAVSYTDYDWSLNEQ